MVSNLTPISVCQFYLTLKQVLYFLTIFALNTPKTMRLPTRVSICVHCKIQLYN